MTGDPIFDAAVSWARQRRTWLIAATSPSPQLTRRQCLYQVRQLEWKIVNCANKAEFQAEHAAHAAHRAAAEAGA